MLDIKRLSAGGSSRCSPLSSHNRCLRLSSRVKRGNTRARALNDDDAQRPIMMPDQKWFMISDDLDAPVYGNGFVISRAQAEFAAFGGVPGLVRYRHPGQLAVRPVLDVGEITAMPWQQMALAAVSEPVSTKIVPFGSAMDAPSAITLAPQDSSMMGMVVSAVTRSRVEAPLPTDEEPVYETFNTTSPRRTRKIQFRCLICGAKNIKPINPHAWAEGSVFAKCGKCEITHKLKDNLKLFHELAGPVFGAPPDIYANLDLPDRLMLNPDFPEGEGEPGRGA